MDLLSGQLGALSHAEASGLRAGYSEPLRDFSFAVSWSTLIRNLEPIQSADQVLARIVEPLATPIPAPSLLPALVPMERPLATKRAAPAEAGARWEMVVPKMVRSAARTSVPPRSNRLQRTSPRFLFMHENSVSLPEKPWLSKTLTAISDRTKSILAGDGAESAEVKDQRTEREQIVSRIVAAVRARSKRADLSLAIHGHGKGTGIS